ncbi:hypothetical protein J7L48_10370 [bacterium]|nr:hypothetical protein [bacterium]
MNKIHKHLYKKKYYRNFYKKNNFFTQKEPIFIARTANTFRFMYLFSKKYKKNDSEFWENEIYTFITQYQRNNGSFANAIGLGNETWMNISSVIRWESYVFYLLSYFGEFKEIGNYRPSLKIVGNNFNYEEKKGEIIYADKKINLGVSKWQKLL